MNELCEIKSKIGHIVCLLFNDKYPEKPLDILDKKVRLKSQKELAFEKSFESKIENNLSPGIYNLDGSLQNPPERDLEFEKWLTEFYKNKKL